MTDDDLAAELKRWRHATEAATAGPWEAHSHHRQYSIWHDELDEPLAREVRNWDDAVFMSAASVAMPRLLAAVEAALKAADDLEAPSLRNPPTRRQIAATFREAITAALSEREGRETLPLDGRLAELTTAAAGQDCTYCGATGRPCVTGPDGYHLARFLGTDLTREDAHTLGRIATSRGPDGIVRSALAERETAEENDG